MKQIDLKTYVDTTEKSQAFFKGNEIMKCGHGLEQGKFWWKLDNGGHIEHLNGDILIDIVEKVEKSLKLF